MERLLTDRQGRRITYLRLSVTDRCNLDCRYCIPPEGRRWLYHDDILRHEEMIRIIRILAERGLQKVRITGGEPLLRKNLVCLIRKIKEISGIREISLTTNGVFLAGQAGSLKTAGIDRINISLDTLKPDVFRAITGHAVLEEVLAGIGAARSAGMSPVKINVVTMAGINDGELEDLAALSFDRDIHVRFIEQMPVGMKYMENQPRLTMRMVMDRLESRWGSLINILPSELDGPARRFRIPGAKGEVGFIPAMSMHFCGTCNRIRLTADGKLRPCLLDDTTVDIRTSMRAGVSDDALAGLVDMAVMKKGDAHAVMPFVNSQMISIGG